MAVRHRIAGALTALLLGATPVLAEPAPPSMPEILATVTREAGSLSVVDSRGAPSDEFTMPELLTVMLYELGVTAPNSDDHASLSAACDPAQAEGRWSCRLSLGIRWQDAESAYIAMFDLEPTHERNTCGEGWLDATGAYPRCAWQIVDQQVQILLAG